VTFLGELVKGFCFGFGIALGFGLGILLAFLVLG